MKKFAPLILIFTFCWTSFSAFADTAQSSGVPYNNTPPLYQVELLVIQLPTTDNAQRANNTLSQSVSHTGTELTTSSNSDKPAPFQLLPQKDFILTHEADRLSQEPGYKILLHIAWLQPLTESTRTIHIFGGQNFAINGKSVWEVDGTFSLNSDEFINTSTDLFFTTVNMFDTQETYQLKQNLRTKVGQLNYQDNPAFGVLFKVIPFSQSE